MRTATAEALDSHTANDRPFDAVYIGRVVTDVFAPNGDLGPEHDPGGKRAYEPGDADYNDQRDRFSELLQSGASRYPGGLLNVCSDDVFMREQRDVKLISVSGYEDDPGADFINGCIQAINECRKGRSTIADATIRIPGFRVPGAIVEHDVKPDGQVGNRMFRVLCGDPMASYLTQDYIEQQIGDAPVVVASSVNDPVVSESVFTAVPVGKAILALNWGTWELKKTWENARRLMAERRPDLIALNLAEAEKLMFGHNGTHESDIARAKTLAEKATATIGGWATTMVITLGPYGQVVGQEGGSLYGEAEPDPTDCDIDTSGAGDRVLARVLAGAMNGDTGQELLRAARKGADSAIREKGGHGDHFSRYRRFLA